VDDEARQALRIERTGSVATYWLDRPARRNAFTQAMWRTLTADMEHISADPSVRLVVFRSAAPGIFSAGADVNEYRANAADVDWALQSQRVVAEALSAVAECAAPTLAAIDGPCFGGGAGLAVACDVRIATDVSTFAVTPAKLGMIYPHSDTTALVDLIGIAATKQILFTGRTFDAAEALRLRFVDEVVPADDLDGAIERAVSAFMAVSGVSVRLMKQAIRLIAEGQRTPDERTDALLHEALASPDFHEGVSAFLDRRPPAFGT
jgi:enoyl-CoA hydratase/carnithine racemase